jgi:hypothetical protein
VSEQYFIFQGCIDGSGLVESGPFSKEGVNYYLMQKLKEAAECERNLVLCQSFDEIQPNRVHEGEKRILIFKGEIVVPQPVEKVLAYEVE